MKNSLQISQAVLFDLKVTFSGCLAEALDPRPEISGFRLNRLGYKPEILGW